MSDVSSVSNSARPTPVPDKGVEYVGQGRVSYHGETMSVMEAVSLLFVERSEVFSDLAADKIKSSQAKLKEIKEAREMLQRMRKLKGEAKGGKSDMPEDMIAWDNKNSKSRSTAGDFWDSNGDGINNRVKYDPDQWDIAIQGTSAHIESLTDSNQLEFLKLKSTVNKLDEAVSASNKMYDKNYDAIKAIFR